MLIDRDTFDKLTAIREDDYRAMLAPCMDNEAVDAAVSRLKDAQRHAARLEREHRVVEDWNAPGIRDIYTRHKVGAKGRSGSASRTVSLPGTFWRSSAPSSDPRVPRNASGRRISLGMRRLFLRCRILQA